MITYHLSQAFLGDSINSVNATVSDGTIISLEEGPPVPGAVIINGLTMPGFANLHSHAFHRFLRGRTHRVGGNFWSWRDAMYGLAELLDPDLMYQIGLVVYGEMVRAGYTAVWEFHYLHHGSDGRGYTDPNAMGVALADAAAEVGIRLVMVDTLYLTSGVDGSEPEGVQRRFSDGSMQAWIERFELLPDRVAKAAAVHSVRAVPVPAMETMAEYSSAGEIPVHVHVSEQRKENEECRAAHGISPVALLDRVGLLGPRTVAVHATHIDERDVERLASTGSRVCMCPTTERDLGDGIGPSHALSSAGVRLSIGSDSQAVIDPLEEVRALEMNARLALERRGVHQPVDLAGIGTDVPGLGSGAITVGNQADFIALDLTRLDPAGLRGEELLAAALFELSARDVTDVVVGGKRLVEDRELRGMPGLDEIRRGLSVRLAESIAEAQIASSEG
jgi:formiminoglutamate deiminase